MKPDTWKGLAVLSAWCLVAGILLSQIMASLRPQDPEAGLPDDAYSEPLPEFVAASNH